MANMHLNPAKTVIAKAGGPKKVSEITGRDLSRVYRWMYPPEKGGTAGIIPMEDAEAILLHSQSTPAPLAHSDFFPASYPEGEVA